MHHRDVSELKFIRVRIGAVLFLIATITVLFVGVSVYTMKIQHENRQAVNILGKQRMYSQMIAKESNSYYILSEIHESKTNVSEKDKELIEIREKIILASKQFNDILLSAKSGTLKGDKVVIDISNSLGDVSSLLLETEGKWQILSDNINILLTDGNNQDKYNNISLINEKSDEIQQLSNSITDTMVNTARNKTKGFIAIYAVLAAFLILSVVFLLSSINRYLVLPLGELYRGMTRIGLTGQKLGLERPTQKEMLPLIQEVSSVFNKLNKLIELIENLNISKSFGDILEYIYKNFSVFIPYNHIGIALIEEEGGSIRAAYGISDDDITKTTQNLFGYKTEIKGTSLASILETGETRIISDLEEHVQGKKVNEYNKILLESGIRSSITLPLKINDKPVGIIFFSSTRIGSYTREHEKFLKTIANSIAICLEKNIFVDDLLYSGILALASLAESRDSDTGEHLNRMKKYSRLITTMMYEESAYSNEINMEYINNMERFSPLHDIGKVAIRDEILLKPGKLTREEFEIMKSHAIYGAEVLKAAESNVVKNGRSVFKLGIEIAEGHHERWDGSGYPYGKAGVEIPLSARIVAVADVFDALTSKRPYKEPYNLDGSFKIIEEGAGRHFDPEVVRVFVKNRERVENLYNLLVHNE